MTARVLVDATNLVAGGAIQVAASLIDELQKLAANNHPWVTTNSIEIKASPQVLSNVQIAGPLPVSSHGRRWRMWQSIVRRGPGYDLAWTVFGPSYGRRIAALEVMGYADVTSVYDSVNPRGARRSLKDAIRTFLSRRSVRTADHVVVETEEMGRRTCMIAGIPISRISVVPNVPHDVFSGQQFDAPQLDGDLVRMLYVARAYPHKNHSFLGELGAELNRNQPAPRFIFVVTLDADEWAGLSGQAKVFCENVGPVAVEGLPALYRSVDAVIFPSLLEAFSATPLEALAAKRPLFASDREFVRTIAEDSAVYFDPTDATAAARTIRTGWRDKEALRRMVETGAAKIELWPTARDRAVACVELLADLT